MGGRALSQCLTNGNLLNGVLNPELALTKFSILLEVEYPLQMGRVYEWLPLPCCTFGGSATHLCANRDPRYSAA